jgi:formiminoglutamase
MSDIDTPHPPHSIPHCTPARWPDEVSPARFAAHVHAGVAVGCRIGLIGLADDTGVRLNGGRPGAADGPRAFRAALASYGAAEPSGWTWPKVFDAGDVEPASGHSEAALHETHRRVLDATSALLDLGLFPVAIGGGHDLTFPFVHAVSKRCRPMTGVYFDAHLDVRDTVGSGMAFRRLVEDCGVRELNVFGFNPLVNARAQVSWFEANGGRLQPPVDDPAWRDALADCLDGRSPGDRPNPPHHHTVFASFDLDALDAAHAPGVSAMNPAGWSVREGERAAFMCGASAAVKCFDLMELNPRHDADGRTARAAAHLFLTFLRGFASRA